MKQLKRITLWAVLAVGFVGMLFATPVTAVQDLTIPGQPVVVDPADPDSTPVTPTPNTPTPLEPLEPIPVEETEPGESPAGSEDGCLEAFGRMGWIMCPGVGLLARFVDTIFGFIQDFLVVQPLLPGDSAIYHIWSVIRDISNFVFIIMLLIAIMSQVTNIGISNYSIKRMLPQVIVVAILVNLSFFIAAALVDVSNILGSQLAGLFTSVAETAAASGAGVGPDAIPTWDKIVTSALGVVGGGGAAVIGLAVVGGWAGLMPIIAITLLGAIVAVMAAFFTLAARQAIIFVMVAVAPLAIVARLMPNTEKYYDLWKKIFLQALMIFPMFAVLFGAAQLAGWAIASSATTTLQLIMGMAVQVVPLILVPKLMQMSGTLMGKVGEMVRKATTRPMGYADSLARRRQEIAKANHLASAHNSAKWYQPSKKLAAAIDRHRALGEMEHKMATERAKHISQKAATDYAKAEKDVNRWHDGEMRTVKEFRHAKYADMMKRASEASSLAEASERDFKSTVNTMGDTVGGYQDALTGEWTKIDRAQMTRGMKKSLAAASASTEAFLDVQTQRHRSALNDQADAQWYANRVKAAYDEGKGIDLNVIDPDTGKPKMSEDYARLVHKATIGLSDQRIGESRVAAQSISAIMAENKKIVDAYSNLYNETRDTLLVRSQVERAFKDNNWQATVAGMQTLVQRGDTDMAARLIENERLEVGSDMEKQLTDAMLGMKKDAIHLWAFAKATKIQTYKRSVERVKLTEDYKTAHADWDTDDDTRAAMKVWVENEIANSPDDKIGARSFNELMQAGTLQQYMSTVTDYGVFKEQDRTVWQHMMDMQDGSMMYKDGTGQVVARPAVTRPLGKQGNVAIEHKMTRSVIFGGVDGEALQNALLYTTGLREQDDALGRGVGQPTVDGYYDSGHVTLEDLDAFLAKSSATNIAAMKTDTKEMLERAYTLKGVTDVQAHVQAVLAPRISQLRSGPPTKRSEMNPSIAEWLDIPTNV